ncbi:hypothetical protein GCM10009854_10730 [Saccharopolyspora halophila]|uniref:Secreted protein n=1 Tax=Saccharopolyspora halophila TaxID=405551 RepID=A0ABN3FSJ4_9PSEU
MRAFRRFSACAAVTLAIAGLSAPAALAQSDSEMPTTPRPHPADPDQPPGRVFPDVPGPVRAQAGTMLGIVRLLPRSVPGESIYNVPEFEKTLPKHSAVEAGMGRAVAQVDSESYFAHEHATADASPVGVSITGQTPQPPGGLSQTALPDHARPTTSALSPPDNPADRALQLSGLNGSVHARWGEETGPCVSDQLSDARYSLGSGSAINSLPGGLGDSLLQIPSIAEAHSNISLTQVDGQSTKAVRSTSELNLSQVTLFAGSPGEVTVEVIGTPKLTATSTGSENTSSVQYTAPVLRISQGGEEIGTIDAANPSMDIPVPGPQSQVLDAGVVKLSIGAMEKSKDGNETRASARLFNLELLSGEALGLPTSLAQISFGEQVVRAIAPEGGVDCEATPPPAAGSGGGDNTAPAAWSPGSRDLAVTGGYHVVPLFWAGTAMLLIGSILVAALPRRNRG